MSNSQVNLSIFILFVFILLSLSPGFVSAQSRADFYPLHRGDYWEWRCRDQGLGGGTIYYVKTREVISDTILPNGQTYFKIIEYSELTGERYIIFERITADLDVARYDVLQGKDLLIFKLGATIGEVWETYLFRHSALESPEAVKIWDILPPDDPVTDENFASMWIEAAHPGSGVYFTLYCGIGVVTYNIAEGDGVSLQKAIIDGRTFNFKTGVQSNTWGRIKSCFR